MNAFSQPQKSHSSVGTMKNGTKSGPTRAQTALAIMLNETTNSSANCARPMTMQHRPVEQVGEDRPGVGLLERVPEGVQTLLRVLDGAGAR